MAGQITVGGITVPLSHPDKVLFPGDGITKADLARYYADVAGRMLPWLRDRPVTMVRYPDGDLEPGQFTMATVPPRLQGGPDPWAEFADSAHGLAEAGKRLARLDA